MLKMGDVAENFINQFHNLPGVTVKEKHQNLFNLLHQNISFRKNPDVLESITKKLKPKNHLEKILYVDFLIYFERFNELYEKYKKGEDITVRKVSKREWFFQKAFKTVEVEEFVGKILPSSSHSLKIKILRKLPVEGQKADEFFDAVCNRYGLFLAANLLQKCSTAKIREILSTQPIKVTESQLKTIYKKDPDSICLYFDQRTKLDRNSSFMNYKPILIYIAQQNPKMFAELFNKYNFTTRIGRRTTKRYLNSEKDQVLERPEKYLKILNNAAVARKLGSGVIDSLLKKSANGENVPWRNFLRLYQKDQRFNIYQKAHDGIFRTCLTDNLDNITEQDFEMMEDNEQRSYLAMKKLEKHDDDKYLKYVKPDYCLKTLKEKVNHMKKSQDRAKYVGIATYCCILNKDYDNFLKVAELVSVRFKNDEPDIRISFFQKFVRHNKTMKKFKEKHWKIVMEIFVTSLAKKERMWYENRILASYLQFLVQNNKSIKEIIQKDFSWYVILSFDDFLKDPKIFKSIVIEFLENGKFKPDPDENFDAAGFDCKLACLCERYNKRNFKDRLNISNLRRILNSVKQVLTAEKFYPDVHEKHGVRYIVCQLTESAEIDELKRLYFKKFEQFGSIKGVMWFLKHDPRNLQKNFDQFLKQFTKVDGLNTRKLWRYLKKYDDLKLAEKTVHFCKKHLREELENKDRLARPLSMLSTPSSHLEFVVEFYAPTKDKVDLTNDDEKELYTIQGKLFKFLHYLNSPAEVAPIALSFCKGDYLPFALASLYSCIYKLPENDTKNYIEKLQISKAISVKKHAMNLSCVIYDKDTIFQCLEKTAVPSVTPSMKYFAKNPSSDLWSLLSKKINGLSKNELLALIPTLDIAVPLEYKTRFVELVWKLLDKHQSKDLKKILLTKVSVSDFPVSVVKGSIFKLEEANNFIVDLLVHVKTEEKYTVMADIFTAYKNNCWDNDATERLARRKMYNFIEKVFQKYMEAKDHDEQLPQKISTLFKSIFPVGEACQEWILLTLMSFKKSTLESCATVLTELNQLLNENYGKYTINMMATIMTSTVYKYKFKTIGDRIKLCQALLQKGNIVNDQLLILKILPKTAPKDKESYELYREIVTKLRQSKDVTVQLQVCLYLKDDPEVDDNTEITWER